MNAEGIQRLIDAAHEAGGGDVTVPAGTHTLETALQLKPTVNLRGEGNQSKLVTEKADTNFIELIPDADGVVRDSAISGLFLKGPGQSLDITEDVSVNATKGCGIILPSREVQIREVHNIVIEQCRIENASGCGIRFGTPRDIFIENITVKDCHLLQNRRPPESRSSVGPVGPDSYKDIYFYGTRFENVHVEGNTCVFTPNASSRYGNDSGIAFVHNNNSDKGSVKNARLISNVCTGHRRHGLVTNYGNMAAFDVEARGNECRDNRWAGLYVNTNYKKVTEGNLVIQGNTCAHNGYGGVGDPKAPDRSIRGGIVLNGCFNSDISNNRCNQNGHPSSSFTGKDSSRRFAAGIRVRGRNLTLKGNETRHNKGGCIARWGLYENVEIENKAFLLSCLFWRLSG